MGEFRVFIPIIMLFLKLSHQIVHHLTNLEKIITSNERKDTLTGDLKDIIPKITTMLFSHSKR